MAIMAPGRSPTPEVLGPHGRHRMVGRDSTLSMAALVVLGVTRVLYGSMISRATDPETYGLVGALIAVTLILSLVLPAGINAAITRYVPYGLGRGEPDAARTVYRWLLRIGLIASTALGMAAALGAAWLGLRPTEIWEVGLLTVAYSSYVIYKAGLYGYDQVQRYLQLEVMSSAIVLGAALIVVMSGSTSYLAPLIAGYSAFVIAAHLSLRASAGRPVGGGRIDGREVAAYVALACVGTLASAGFLQATQVLAAGLVALTDAAYFTATITLISMLYFLPRALGLALFPFMAEAHGAGKTALVRDQADRVTRALLALLAPAFVAGVILAGEALVVYGGSPFLDGALIMQIVLLASFLSVVQVPSVNALSSASREGLKVSAGWAVAGAACGLALVAIVGLRIGALGIALAYLAGTAVTAVGPISVVWRRYQMPWAGPAVRAMGAVCLAFVAARLLAVAVPVDGVPWIRDGVAALTGVAVSLLLLRSDLRWVVRAARRSRPVGSADPLEPSSRRPPTAPELEPDVGTRS